MKSNWSFFISFISLSSAATKRVLSATRTEKLITPYAYTYSEDGYRRRRRELRRNRKRCLRIKTRRFPPDTTASCALRYYTARVSGSIVLSRENFFFFPARTDCRLPNYFRKVQESSYAEKIENEKKKPNLFT